MYGNNSRRGSLRSPYSRPVTPQSRKSTRRRTIGTSHFEREEQLLQIHSDFSSPLKILARQGHDDYLLPIDEQVTELYVPLIQFCAMNSYLVPAWNNPSTQKILKFIQSRTQRMANPADVTLKNYQHLIALMNEVSLYARQQNIAVPQNFYNLMYETAIIACTHLEELVPRMEMIIFLLDILKFSLQIEFTTDDSPSNKLYTQIQTYITLTITDLSTALEYPFQIHEHLQALFSNISALMMQQKPEYRINLSNRYYAIISTCFSIIYDSFAIWTIQNELGKWLNTYLLRKRTESMAISYNHEAGVYNLKQAGLSASQRLQHILKTLTIPEQYNQLSDHKILIDWQRNTIYMRNLGGTFIKFNNSLPKLLDIHFITAEIREKLGVSDPNLVLFLSRFSTQEGLVGCFPKLWQEHLDYCAQAYAPIDSNYRYIYIDNKGTHIDVFCILFIKCISGEQTVLFSPKVPLLFSCRIDWHKGLENCMSQLQAHVMSDFVIDSENQLREDWFTILKNTWPEK